MINYFNSSLQDSNDDMSLIKKMAHLYVKLVIRLYPEHWPTPFQELLEMVNKTKIIPNGNAVSLVHVDMLTFVLEIINCDVIERAINNNSTIDRTNAKNLKECMASRDITDISSCLVQIIKAHNTITPQVLDRSLSAVVDMLSWANWHIFSTVDFVELLINIINMRKSASINALRIISALGERGMNHVQKVEFLFQKLNIINVIKQLFANIINDGINVQMYSPLEIQFLTARNRTLAVIIHQIYEIYSSYRSENEVSTENANISTLIKDSISQLSHIQTICFKIYPLVSIIPLVPSACDLLSYIKHENLEEDKTFANIIIDLFTCTLKHASYPNWYNKQKGLDENEFDDCRNSLISIVRALFAMTPNIAISELSKNIGYICSFRHRVLPCQSEIIITSILIAIEVVKANSEIINAILPLFQTNSCNCCNQISFILNELSQNSFVSHSIHELISKISKIDKHVMFIKPSLQYLTLNMNNTNSKQITLLKFVKNSLDHFDDANKCSNDNLTSNLINSIKPYIGISFVKIGFEINDLNHPDLIIHYNDVFYEILSTIISNKPSIVTYNYFYETLDYLYNIINQINSSQDDHISLSFWLFRILSAFASLIKSFKFSSKDCTTSRTNGVFTSNAFSSGAFSSNSLTSSAFSSGANGSANGDFALETGGAIIKFAEIALQLIEKYAVYFYIRNISLSICRKLILLGKTDCAIEAFNSIVRIIKPFYNHIDLDEDDEYCSFNIYLLKSFPANFFTKDYLAFIINKHLKYAVPAMEIVTTSKSSDLWRRYNERIFQFLNLLLVATNTLTLDDIFGNFVLDGFDFDGKLNNYSIKDKLLLHISDNSADVNTLLTFLLLSCNSYWEDFISSKISLLALQIVFNIINLTVNNVKLPIKLIFHTCCTWIIDGKNKGDNLQQKILFQSCKIIHKLTPTIDYNSFVHHSELVNTLNKYSTLNVNEFARKMADLNNLSPNS